MKYSIPGFALITVLALSSIEAATVMQTDDTSDNVASWDFDVFLNKKRIGKHLFSISETDGEMKVLSEASFKYNILFVPVYQYEHSADERWMDSCLVALDTSTDSNGTRLQVSGEKTAAGFRVDTGDDEVQLPDCVMTFAYWNPEFLGQTQLLNPQTGDYMDVQVEEVGEEVLIVRGQAVEAMRFKLTADNIDLTLWYSTDNEWLALRSIAKGGHVIRYELS
jgi:hypothetical protein